MELRQLDAFIVRVCVIMGGVTSSLLGNGYDASGVEVHYLGNVTIENAAVLDASGKPYTNLLGGPDARYHSVLHDLLADTYVESRHNFSFKTDPTSEAKYRKVIQEFPRFPFGYYAMALTLRHRHDPGWRNFAETAVSIFERTTKIPGCNQNHFDGLKELREYLAVSTP